MGYQRVGRGLNNHRNRLGNLAPLGRQSIERFTHRASNRIEFRLLLMRQEL